MRAFLSTPADSERAPHPTPARPQPLCTEHRFGQASGLCEAVLLWGVGCPWMRPPRVWGPRAAVGGPVQRAPGSAGRRREGASRRGAWLHPAPRWASLGVAGCSVFGVTKEAGGNPGTAGVLEAKTGAQGTAVEVRCCPEVRTVMRPGLRPRPRERALPGPSTGEPAPAPGLLRAGRADRGGLGALGASPSSCAWTEPGVRGAPGAPGRPCHLAGLPQRLFCLGRLRAPRPQACSEAPLEWPAAPRPRGTPGQLGA